MTSASSAHPSSLGGTTSASSAFPRSERVYPAIMPLGAISPGGPSWRKASRYVRTGRDDLRVVRTATVPNRGVSAGGGPSLNREGRPPRRPHITPNRGVSACGGPSLYGGGMTSVSSALQPPRIVASPLAEACTFMGEGRPPRRPPIVPNRGVSACGGLPL